MEEPSLYTMDLSEMVTKTIPVFMFSNIQATKLVTLDTTRKIMKFKFYVCIELILCHDSGIKCHTVYLRFFGQPFKSVDTYFRTKTFFGSEEHLSVQLFYF